jgi:Collagen triple helix repeat (20 copies)
MSRQSPHKRSRAAAGALAATGFAASAALGIGAATASPVGASSSTKIYACYSDSNDALSYLDYPTVKSCANGSTRISWNVTGAQGAQGARGVQGSTGAQGAVGAQGPQGGKGQAGPSGPQGAAGAKGPQGATGPQGARGVTGPQGATGQTGPAGAVAGFIASASVLLPKPHVRAHGSLSLVPAVVTHISPGSANDAVAVYAVVDVITSNQKENVDCWVQDTSPTRSGGSVVKSKTHSQAVTVPQSASFEDLDVLGILYPRTRSAGVSLVCEGEVTASYSAYVEATLTTTGLSAATREDSPRRSTIISNKFREALERHHAGTRAPR